MLGFWNFMPRIGVRVWWVLPEPVTRSNVGSPGGRRTRGSRIRMGQSGGEPRTSIASIAEMAQVYGRETCLIEARSHKYVHSPGWLG